MEDFEKFIKNNKHAFDAHKADEYKLWSAIESELDVEEPSVKQLSFWQSSAFKVAASVVLIMALSITSLSLFNNDKINTAKQAVDNELIEIDMHYKHLVSKQIEEFKSHPKLSEQDKKEFLEFIDELDEEYKALKLEMQNNLSNERVLEAIINNYKKRIELLQKLKTQIEHSKTEMDYEGYIL